MNIFQLKHDSRQLAHARNWLKEKRIILIANRKSAFSVLNQLNVIPATTFIRKNSYLEREVAGNHFQYRILPSKSELIKFLKNQPWDILVSNGCPFILPVTELNASNRKFVNIHPSLLPDLRGKSPINGAVLFDRPTGASCHLMDDSIDTGHVIHRTRIASPRGIDLGLLYKLCLEAEQEAFFYSCLRLFQPLRKQRSLGNTIYYSRSDQDMAIDWSNDLNKIVNTISAFGTLSQGAWFPFKSFRIRALRAQVIQNGYLQGILDQHENGEVIFKYDRNLVVKCHERALKIEIFDDSLSLVCEGDRLF